MRSPFPSVKPNGGTWENPGRLGFLQDDKSSPLPGEGSSVDGGVATRSLCLLCGCRCVKAGGIWGRWGLWGSIPRGHILSLGRWGCFNFWECSKRAVGSLGNEGLGGTERQGQRASGLRGQEDTQASCAETTKEQRSWHRAAPGWAPCPCPTQYPDPIADPTPQRPRRKPGVGIGGWGLEGPRKDQRPFLVPPPGAHSFPHPRPLK